MEEQQAQESPRRVSVIVATFNNAEALRRLLVALENSRERDTFEVLVVDCGSVDECPRIDAEFPSVNVLRLPRHFGMVKALNIGMRTATGEFFLFLEPAMEVTPGAVGALVAELDRDQTAAAAAPRLETPSGDLVSRVHPLPLPSELQRTWLEGELADWQRPEFPEQGALEVDYIKPPAMMVRSYFLKGLRYIDSRYSHAWWDLEICTQIGRAGKKILLLGSARVIQHPPGLEQPPSSVRGLIAADRAIGAAVWCGKHYGWFQGVKFRVVAILRALASLASLREAGYRFSALSCLVSGQKFDGSQRAL
ncbi:MAG TPA: glycosyltransferase [Bryobacteraceae bacterium]|nr:glycosyltransferase [Bryobacteraceae bacterium]